MNRSSTIWGQLLPRHLLHAERQHHQRPHRGIGGVAGCNNVRTVYDSDPLIVVKELLKNDVTVLTTDKRVLFDMEARRQLEAEVA